MSVPTETKRGNQMTAKCFACDRPITPWGRRAATCKDEQFVYVGSECFKHIERAGREGWQPPKGGPRLYTLAAKAEAAHNITSIVVRPAVQFQNRFGGKEWTTQNYTADAEQAFELKHGKSSDYRMRARFGVWVEQDGHHTCIALLATRPEAEQAANSLRWVILNDTSIRDSALTWFPHMTRITPEVAR